MPYQGYGPPDNRRYYWKGQIKTPTPFPHGFAPNAANFVKKLIFHECTIPLQVYIETFIPCYIDMVLFITIPYFDDIVRASGEAIAGGGVARGNWKHRHTSKSQLPAPETKAQRRAQQALRTVLTITQPLEKIGYTFLLYAGTERFFYNWNSLLYGFEHCGKPPSEGPLQRHSDAQGLPISPAPRPLFMNILDQNRANWSNSNQLATVPRGHYQVTIEATFRSRAINVSHVQTKISCPFSIPYDDYESGYIRLEAGGTGSCVFTAHVFFPLLTGGTIQWLYDGDAVPIGIDILSCSVSIYSFQPGR
jgi:hypothetical protein